MCKAGKNLNHFISLMYSYMDDIYPGMNTPFELNTTSAAQIYIHCCVVISILIIASIHCIKEPTRIYIYRKRKNTDESPIINV